MAHNTILRKKATEFVKTLTAKQRTELHDLINHCEDVALLTGGVFEDELTALCKELDFQIALAGTGAKSTQSSVPLSDSICWQ